jgi:phosphate:Na+ symporter
MSVMGFLLEIFGAVALLLWGTHMVTSGMLRGFGSQIRKTIGQALSGKLKAFFTGMGVTLALQSSTATGLMASSFSANGLLALEPGFMLMLGANVGTAIVAKILSFPIHAIAPLLMMAGVFGFRAANSAKMRNMARVFLGLGLMMMSLRLLVSYLAALPDTSLTHQAFGVMAQQPVLAIFFGAMAAWVCHSSVAVVLLVMSVAATGDMPLAAGLAAVLGANLGGALGPVMEAHGIAARRLPLANLAVRACGVAGGALLVPLVTAWLEGMGTISPSVFVDAHLVFNLTLAVLAAPLARPLCALLVRVLPDPPIQEDPGRPRHLLSPQAEAAAPLRLAGAEREALRVADLIAAQLASVGAVLMSGDSDASQRVSTAGDAATALGAEIRRAITAFQMQDWSAEEVQRSQEIQVFTVNLEHAADIVAHQIAEPVMRRHREEGAFPSSHADVLIHAITELSTGHEVAVAAFLRRDIRAAREVVASKIKMREEEREHLRSRTLDNATTSLMRPDIDDDLKLLREMRRVMGHIAAIAYELLEEAGQLRTRMEI